MRVAIIIIGVIGLIVLGLKWDSLSPTPHHIPQEGTIIKEQKAAESLACPECGEELKSIRLENDEVVVNL